MENKAHPTLTCDQAFFLFGEERNWAKKKGRRLPDHRFILRTRLRLKFWGEHCCFYQCQHEKIISTRNAVNVWLNISIHCSPSTSKLTPHKDVLRALSRIPSHDGEDGVMIQKNVCVGDNLIATLPNTWGKSQLGLPTPSLHQSCLDLSHAMLLLFHVCGWRYCVTLPQAAAETSQPHFITFNFITSK